MSRRDSGWEDFDFSIDSMKKIHKKLFGTEFNPEDRAFIGSIVNPIEPDSIINQVSRASSEIRDRNIVQEIKKYMAEGYSVYAEFGASHAVMQEPAIKGVSTFELHHLKPEYSTTPSPVV